MSVLSVPPSDPEDRETEENISAESPFPFLIHITGTSGTVAVLFCLLTLKGNVFLVCSKVLEYNKTSFFA